MMGNAVVPSALAIAAAACCQLPPSNITSLARDALAYCIRWRFLLERLGATFPDASDCATLIFFAAL